MKFALGNLSSREMMIRPLLSGLPLRGCLNITPKNFTILSLAVLISL